MINSVTFLLKKIVLKNLKIKKNKKTEEIK